MKIINYRDEFYPQITQLEAKNLDNTNKTEGFLWQAHPKDYFNSEDYILVDGDNLVGIMAIKSEAFDESYSPYEVDLQQDNNVYVEAFVIDDKYRGMGIGSQALTYLFNLYPDKQIVLEVDSENEAGIAFYKKIGMTMADGFTLFDGRKWRLYYRNPTISE